MTRKVQRSGRTLADAQQNLEKALKGRHVVADDDAELSRDSTVNDPIAEWLTEARAAGRGAQGTLRTYSTRADSTIKPGIGGVRLSEVTVPKLDRFVKTTTKHHGPGTARTVRTVLINAFDLAARHGLADFNLAKNIAPIPATRKTPEAPSRETVYALIQHLKQYDAELAKKKRAHYLPDLMMMYVATGAHTAEILALQWDSVSLEASPPRVGIEAALIVNEGGKLKRQEYTKSDAGMRSLAVPRSAAVMLQDRRVKSYNAIVFPSSTGTFRWPHNLRRDWRDAVDKTAFQGMTPKSFRKAVATLLRDEMGIEAARDQLGHSDERVTKAHYAQRLAEAPDTTSRLRNSFKGQVSAGFAEFSRILPESSGF